MYIYGFYNFEYDETTFIKLGHDQRFTKEEFEDIVNKCRVETEEQLQKNLKRIDSMNDDEITSEDELKELNDLCHEHQINDNIYNRLKKYYGFIELEPIYTYTFNGGFYGEGQKLLNKVET